jgi:cold shock protein
MGTGKIIRFDADKGYGLIAPDNGDDDVFLHAKQLRHVGRRVGVGTRLSFDVIQGARGLKAYGIQVVEDYHSGNGPDAGNSTTARNGVTVLAQRRAGTCEAGHDGTCEVFSEDEFSGHVTKLILEAVPQLTGEQIVQLRGRMLEFARANSWVAGAVGVSASRVNSASG